MSKIESLHVIYKNLIAVGREMDVDKFRGFFVDRGFTLGERVIPTPTGPLKEFLLRDPRTMRDLVVCSVRGFVVDSRDYENARRLLDLAYDAFEYVYGDDYKTLVLNIQVLVNILAYIKDGDNKLMGLVDRDKMSSLMKRFGRRGVYLKVIGFRWGERSSEEGEVSVSIGPVFDPTGKRVLDRFNLTLEYLGQNPDKGIEFFGKVRENAMSFIDSIIS